MKKIPVTGAMTTHQMSYTVENCTPYEETKHRRKTRAMQESSLGVDELEDLDDGIDGTGGSINGGWRRPEP